MNTKKISGGEIMGKRTETSPDGKTIREFNEKDHLVQITRKIEKEEAEYIGGTHMVVLKNTDEMVYIGYLAEVRKEEQENKQVVVLDEANIVNEDGWSKPEGDGQIIIPSENVLRIESGEFVFGRRYGH